MTVPSPGYGPGPESPNATRPPTVLLMASTPWVLFSRSRVAVMTLTEQFASPGSPTTTKPPALITLTDPPTKWLPHTVMAFGDDVALIDPSIVELTTAS